MNPIQKMLRSGVFTEKVVPNFGAERIGLVRSCVNKILIRHEMESETWVIRYRVNGA